MSEVEQKTAKVNFRLEDKIGLGPPTYSSVVYGLSITRDVPDNDDLDEVMGEAKAIAAEAENFMANEREKILEFLQGKAFAEVKK